MPLKKIILGLGLVSLLGCKLTKSHDSKELMKYQSQHPEVKNLGAVRFMTDPLGSFSLQGLMDGNIMPIKIYGTALLLAEKNPVLDSQRVPDIFEKYGFMKAVDIKNWKPEYGPQVQNQDNLGIVHADIEEKILGKKYKIEVANITCGACHSTTYYDAQGLPTHSAWIGGANTSAHFDGLLAQIYQGLVIGLNDKNLFLEQIKKAYPQMDSDEEKTIRKEILPRVFSEIKKMKARGSVLPFKNGGPGLANGLGQFKKNAGLFPNNYNFYQDEATFVQIPDLTNRIFKSSFTVDGINGSRKFPRFQEINSSNLLDPARVADLARIVTFFSYLAMGTIAENLKEMIPRTEEIFNGFLKDRRPQLFPGVIDEVLAMKGSAVFNNNCSQCHGVYSSGIKNIQMLSFPNKLIPGEKIHTDPARWRNVTPEVIKFAEESQLSAFTKAQYQKGYVAPILSGLWTSAPYLHNGSVPTLWQLMYPESRPVTFEVGGHAIDFDLVGVKGEVNDHGDMRYSTDYKPVSQSFIYDTREYGKSNQGHERPFVNLSDDDKRSLLEYLKML